MLTPTKLRHFCRNPRCRSKLKASVESKHRAFCTRGCFESFYLKRCRVCERDLRSTRGGRLYCRPPSKCRLEASRRPGRYQWLPPYRNAQSDSKSAHLTGVFWRDETGGGWRWEETDEDHKLFERDGRLAAWIEGGGGIGGWRIIDPEVCLVLAPLLDLETAKRRARDVALWALPSSRPAAPPAGLGAAPENPAAIFQRSVLPMNLLGGHRFDDARALDRDLVKTITRTESRLCEPLPFVSSPGIVPASVPDVDDPLAIPQFLIRQAAVT
jgi:hypothetical protein